MEDQSGLREKYKINKFPIRITDGGGLLKYIEYEGGSWFRYEHDSEGRLVFKTGFDGVEESYKYDSKGNQIEFKDNQGTWTEKIFNHEGELFETLELGD